MHVADYGPCVAVRFLALGFVSATVLAGCTPAGPAGTVPIVGSVRSAGQEVPQGTVHFVGKDDAGLSGAAAIGSDGRFRANLRPGVYRVAVIAKDGVDTMDEKGMPIVAKSLVPEKYGNVATSGLEANVSSSNRTVDLDLQP